MNFITSIFFKNGFRKLLYQQSETFDDRQHNALFLHALNTCKIQTLSLKYCRTTLLHRQSQSERNQLPLNKSLNIGTILGEFSSIAPLHFVFFSTFPNAVEAALTYKKIKI